MYLMDTLFRLVSLQAPDQQSFNSSTTTTTNSGNSHNYHLYPSGHVAAVVPDEECFNFFMDEEDFSSSSSKPHAPPPHHHQEHLYQPYSHHHQEQHVQHAQLTNYPSTGTTTPTSSSTYHGFGGGGGGSSGQFGFSPASGVLGFDFSGGNWAAELLVEAARAMAGRDSARVQHLMWMLNELSSPYGDVEQKLAAYFLQALFSRMTDSGQRCYNTLASASDKASSFDSTRKTILRFQELSPWTTFGHVAANAAIMEAFDGESNLHIVDLSNTFCTQWPTLLESLATRADDTPHLRLTTVIGSGAGAGAQRVLKEIGARMEKFARLMGVPFKFAAVHVSGDPSEINPADLGVVDGEALAVNLIGALRSVPPAGRRREALISTLRSLNPKIITVVEEEADLAGGELSDEGSGEFVRTFAEAVRWFRLYLEALDEAFPRTSNERLALERAAGRAVVDVVARPAEESVERREEAVSWARRLRSGGFETVSYSEEVCDDVRALLRRYKEGWAMTPGTDGGMFLTWRDTPVVWASAWRPA